ASSMALTPTNSWWLSASIWRPSTRTSGKRFPVAQVTVQLRPVHLSHCTAIGSSKQFTGTGHAENSLCQHCKWSDPLGVLRLRAHHFRKAPTRCGASLRMREGGVKEDPQTIKKSILTLTPELNFLLPPSGMAS